MQIKSSQKISLLELLGQLAPDSSKNTLRSWIEKGRVFVDGKLADHAKQIVAEGQVVTVGAKTKFLKKELKIVYEDDDIVVIDKPAGLLSVATETEDYLCAHTFLKRRFNTGKVYPIHRLDRETSGLLVFAYSEMAREHLKQQLEKREIHREYRAKVHGDPGEGAWRCFLRENIQLRVEKCQPNQGKEAVTHFTTIKREGNYSWLKLKLETGRKHQIRVQAALAGHPVVGDDKYGVPEDKGKNLELYAVELHFIHPRTQKLLRFQKTVDL